MNTPVVLGIDFGGTKTAMAVAEAATGLRLGTATVPTHAAEGGKASLARGLRAARALLDRVAPGREPLAVGVSTIGIPREAGVDLAPNIPGWADLALAREVRAAFPDSEIRVETDVKAAARVEAVEGALKDADPGLYLNLGTGLAVALVAGGEVVAGRNGASGEIGYNLRSVADVGAPTGKRSILEDGVSGIGLLARAKELFPDATGAQDLFAAAGHDERAASALKEFADELAFHLVNLAIALDPARIAVGGGMVRSWAALHGPLRRALDAAVPFPPELVQAAFPFDAPLAGALTLARAAARPQPSTAL
ncbi:ROK family protein [Catenulispora subtropica]|uniref:ROK family protein n=1 Tax=Catenulispora subtropica TaxID=450798 RepID=A0ABP5E716_9ACTN